MGFSYWHEVDTLIIDLLGSPLPAVSVPIDLGDDRDYLYLRVDPGRNEVVGIQIEDFLAFVVGVQPHLLDLLDLAELHGITVEEVSRIRHDVARTARESAVIADLFEELQPLTA